MSERATPETDAHILESLHEKLMGDYLARLNRMIPFCRKLERERDEAREQAHEAIASWVEMLALARELRDSLQSSHKFASVFSSASPTSEHSKMLRKAEALLTKANEVLP